MTAQWQWMQNVPKIHMCTYTQRMYMMDWHRQGTSFFIFALLMACLLSIKPLNKRTNLQMTSLCLFKKIPKVFYMNTFVSCSQKKILLRNHTSKLDNISSHHTWAIISSISSLLSSSKEAPFLPAFSSPSIPLTHPATLWAQHGCNPSVPQRGLRCCHPL